MEMYAFEESSRELRNPERGFYQIYGCMITDEKQNYTRLVEEWYEKDKDTSLALIEINLQHYRDSEISESGMDNIEALFQALDDFDKQVIVRFLYDWEGENEKYEPESIDLILNHMEQLENVLRKFSAKIFVIQGLFVGNWGEMNGTEYNSGRDLKRLAEQLETVTDAATYLAVRTPSQWRKIIEPQGKTKIALKNDPRVKKLGLFNDGMLGSESDYGTYEYKFMNDKTVSTRAEELVFQEALCSFVPNGGEVIRNNLYNDFNNAVKDLATMHVTYLNEKYDQEVFDKWKKTKVLEDSCYNGMDGYTYIERHLGYRLLIEKAGLHHNFLRHRLEVEVSLKNVGFAPLYVEPEAELIFYDKEKEEKIVYRMNGNLRSLTGGNEKEQIQTLEMEIDLCRLPDAEYDVYFSLIYPKTGQYIVLANEQERDAHGYCIGKIAF